MQWPVPLAWLRSRGTAQSGLGTVAGLDVANTVLPAPGSVSGVPPSLPLLLSTFLRACCGFAALVKSTLLSLRLWALSRTFIHPSVTVWRSKLQRHNQRSKEVPCSKSSPEQEFNSASHSTESTMPLQSSVSMARAHLWANQRPKLPRFDWRFKKYQVLPHTRKPGIRTADSKDQKIHDHKFHVWKKEARQIS